MRTSIFLFASAISMLVTSTGQAAQPAEPDAATRGQIVQVLRDGLSSDQFWPSMHAAEALSLAGHGDEVRAALATKLHSTEDAQHRCGVARELFRAGDKSAVDVLFAILADEDPHGHVHACESLFKINQIGDGQLLRKHMKDDQQPTKQLMAAAALGRSGDAQAMALLRRELKNEDDNIARIAAWVLAVNGDKSDLPGLRERAKTIVDPVYQNFVTATLATLGDKQAAHKLQAALASDDAGIRVFAAEFCGHAKIVSASDTLKRLLNDENLDVRVRAAQSLILLKADTSDAR